MLEVTLRTHCALAYIEAIARPVPEAIVGAGTVRSVADARAPKAAGSAFGVSPGYTAAVGAACREAELPLLLGVATASEVMAAQADGLHFLKFFAATAAGGIPMLEALAGRSRTWPYCAAGGAGGLIAAAAAAVAPAPDPRARRLILINPPGADRTESLPRRAEGEMRWSSSGECKATQATGMPRTTPKGTSTSPC